MTKIPDKVHLDDVLHKFSVWGPYHSRATVCFILAHAFNTIADNNYIFITDKVNYRCSDSDSWINTTQYLRYDYRGCDSSSSSCKRWVYEDPTSFVAEFDLACQEWKRTLVGTMHSFGYMVGLLIVGPLSDRWGRKIMIIVTCIGASVVGLGRSFVTNYWLYAFLEFLEPVIGDPCSTTFILSIEMVPAEKRVIYSTITGLGLTIGELIYPFVYSLISNWRVFLRVVYAPGFLFLICIFLIDESPRWLLTKGKKEKAIAIIKSAAKTNQLELKMDLNNILYHEEKSANFSTVLLETFRSKSMLKRFSVCSVWWIASTFVDHGLTINSVSLQGNKYVNFALTSLARLPGQLIVIRILRFKRKLPLIFTFIICAVLCGTHPFCDAIPWLSKMTFVMSRAMSTLYLFITYIYTSELFPTYTRNSMHALCSAAGRIGSMAATQVPLLMLYSSGLPAFIFSSVSLTAGMLTFFVPDSAGDELPDTISEAEALGKNEDSLEMDNAPR